ncbi:hypothetical protein [Oscillibacter sp.]|jgi:hypothetical protein|uniref:hypothetical protein n=1 Tax=Oscillibacter sp. TaxID=1945593 RepID=UPI00216E3691|nr:hypothetical protein [Oscillibacter sp.]MCI9649380.1 hypothetical protein [Oscillibacter sp.]
MEDEIFLRDGATGRTYRLGVERRGLVLTETADVSEANVILEDRITEKRYSFSLENGVLKLLEV